MSLNIVFMGTPDFAKKSLEHLAKTEHKISAVVAQPDKPKGRGMKLSFPPVKEFALEKGFKVFQPQRMKDDEFIGALKSINPDVIVVVAYGKILPKVILDLPKYGCINVHASLLPKYRGAAPIQWPIINGEEITGVTTMYMDEGLDTGDMILKNETIIGQDDTFQTMHDKLAELGGEAIVQTLELIEQGKVQRIHQDELLATHTRQIKKEDGLVNWNDSAVKIKNLVRGFNPWPGALTYYNGKIMKLWKVEVVDDIEAAEPGTIIQSDCKRGLLVCTGNGAIKITELQPEGGKRMSSETFLIGNKLPVGEKFDFGSKKL